MTWHDSITYRAFTDTWTEGPPVTERCPRNHGTPAAAYTCGAARLRRLVHVGRGGHAARSLAFAALEVWPYAAARLSRPRLRPTEPQAAGLDPLVAREILRAAAAPGGPVIPAGQIAAEVAADVHRLAAGEARP